MPHIMCSCARTHRRTALHCTALHCTALHCTALYCTALHCTALHCTALHCTALHCTALHCTALHCTALHCYSCTPWCICKPVCALCITYVRYGRKWTATRQPRGTCTDTRAQKHVHKYVTPVLRRKIH